MQSLSLTSWAPSGRLQGNSPSSALKSPNLSGRWDPPCACSVLSLPSFSPSRVTGGWRERGNGAVYCKQTPPPAPLLCFPHQPFPFAPFLPLPSGPATPPLVSVSPTPAHQPTSCCVSEGFLSRHPRALLVAMALAGADSSVLACLCLLHQLAVRQRVSAWAGGVLSSSSVSQPCSLCSAPGLPELTAFLGQPQPLSGSIRGRWCCPGRTQRLGSCAR